MIFFVIIDKTSKKIMDTDVLVSLEKVSSKYPIYKCRCDVRLFLFPKANKNHFTKD